MNSIKIFNYNGSDITFENNGEVMVNATEMAKPFGKLPTDFLKTQRTQEFINELSVMKNIITVDLVQVRQGGSVQGTWMHEDVAIEFARWLNPRFAIWCNDRIKELLKHGATALNPDDLLNPDFIISLATELKRERAEKEQLKARSELQQKELSEAAPKVQYHDEVLQSESTYTITQIAKELGMGPQKLNERLKELGVQYKQSGQWLLYFKHQGKGYTKTKTYSFTRKDLTPGTNIETVWTEKGRLFIHQLLKESVAA
jgi:phage antirepressor YoqD-like protein